MSRSRAALHAARNVLIYALDDAAVWSEPILMLFRQNALEAVLEALEPGQRGWERKALADTRAAVKVIEAKYERNIERDCRVIPH